MHLTICLHFSFHL